MKKKHLTVVLALAITVVLATTAAYASVGSKVPENEVVAKPVGSSTENGNLGSLAAPADASASGTKTLLKTNNSIEFLPSVSKFDENNVRSIQALGPPIVISPMAEISFGNVSIAYNTRTKFTQTNGDAWIIRKGVTARFKFELDSNQHYEVGFMDKNYNVIEMFWDGEAAGINAPFTPQNDVEGYFYIWNKSAAAFTAKKITMTY
ncbi:hypothetical protein [Cohnella sp.]|uniref:hypothetical protein n=1 Tax=Cohnella sp. TaxID=1883426 RepID=UPI0035647AE3